MKNFKKLLFCFAMCTFVFSACTKDNENIKVKQSNAKATLSFATVVNDLLNKKAALKQEVGEIPECSDAAPATVEVIVTDGDGNSVIGSSGTPYSIDVNGTPGDYDEDGEDEYFTEFDPNLELSAGDYTLTHFMVYDGDGNLIWVAPKEAGDFDRFVTDPLPIDFTLEAGVKLYVDVEVLCFDDRLVNDYGYLFFEIEDTELYEFCFFANYCKNEGGRDYPGRISVDVWLGTDNTGALIYENLTSAVENDGEPSAEPVCFFLPDYDDVADDEEYVYYEVTILDWPGVYDAEGSVISGTLSPNDITGNFDGADNLNYQHLIFGCGDTEEECEPSEGDLDGDCIPNNEDPCINDPNNECCQGPDSDQDGVPDDCDICAEGDDTVDTDSDGTPDACDPCPEDSNDECTTDDYGDPLAGCETAFMFGAYELNEDFEEINSNRWGWATWVEGDGIYTADLWAGAGGNDTSSGTLAGQITYEVDGDEVTITIDLQNDNSMSTVHIYADGDEPETAAPGQYGNTFNASGNNASFTVTVEDFDENGFWLIVHADVNPEGEECPEPE